MEQLSDLTNGNSGHVFIVVRCRKVRSNENQQEYKAGNSVSPGKSVFIQMWFIQWVIRLHNPCRFVITITKIVAGLIIPNERNWEKCQE
jgi:hypothetical protein